MSPRLTSSTTSAPAARQRGDRALEHGDAARAVRLEERRLRLDDGGRCRERLDADVGEARQPVARRRAAPRRPAAPGAGRCRRTASRAPVERGVEAARRSVMRGPRGVPGRSVLGRGGRSRRRRRRWRIRARRARCSSSASTRTGADGSPNTAVPTETADAPARMNCSASSPVRMPPMPRIGRCGRACAPATRSARATGRIAGPDSPPVTPPSAGRIVSVSITMPEQGVDQREAVGAGVGAGARDQRDVGDVGRQLGEHRLGRVGRAPHRADHPRRGDRVAGEHLAAVLDVRAGDVDLEHRHGRMPGQPARQLDVLVGVRAGDRHDRARAVLGAARPGRCR